MRMIFTSSILATLVSGLALVAPAAMAGASESAAVILRAGDMQWAAADSLPAGVQISTLMGEPAGTDVLAFRLKIPAGTKIAPHFHPKDETVTVIEGSGKMTLGDGSKADDAQDFGAGDVCILPAGHTHAVEALTPMIVEIHTVGPWGITFINSEDDVRH